MSNTGNQPPGGTPPASKPGDEDSPPSSQSGTGAKAASTPTSAADGSQTPPASAPAPDSSPPPASTPAPASTPPDSSPASAPASAPDSQADSKPPDSSPPASDASPPSSQAPDSKPPDSDGCAEIPTAAHAVLTADVKFFLELPITTDEASQLPHKFTLTSDDGSVNQTLTLASDAEVGDVDGTVVLTFKNLAEHHTYTLQCANGDNTYTLFEGVDYDQLAKLPPGSPAASTGSDPTAGGGDPNGGGASS